MLRPGEAGYTYDGKENRMLSKKWQSRLDRILVRAEDWVLSSIEMVGTAAIPGVLCKKGGSDAKFLCGHRITLASTLSCSQNLERLVPAGARQTVDLHI